MSDRMIEFIINAVAVVAIVVTIATVESCKMRSCRASYLEGRYNLDRATAWQLAGER